jgi:hypothetical protein
MLGLEFIRDPEVVMVIAGAVGWLCQRVGLSLVVGYRVGAGGPAYGRVLAPDAVTCANAGAICWMMRPRTAKTTL